MSNSEIGEGLKSFLIDNAIKKRSRYEDTTSLWGECKSYCNLKNIEMGGGFLSSGDFISCTFNINGEIIRFKISIKDVEDARVN